MYKGDLPLLPAAGLGSTPYINGHRRWNTSQWQNRRSRRGGKKEEKRKRKPGTKKDFTNKYHSQHRTEQQFLGPDLAINV
jgi:hypothetical protein